MLEDNGYAVEENQGVYTFKHSSSAAVGVIVIAILVAIFNFIFIAINPVPGIIAFVMLIIATITVMKKLVGKVLIKINIINKTFTISTSQYSCDWTSFDSINEIILKSKYVDEYTSAFKSTSEEHRISINIKLGSHEVIQLFKFSSDYADPTPEIQEVYSFLEGAFRK